MKCPNCGVEINGIGRKKLDIPVINVYDAVQAYPTVVAAAKELGCSRGWVYKVLKDNKKTAKGVRGR